MRDIDLLSAWESSLAEAPLRRTSILLAAAGNEAPDRLGVGEREAAFLRLHRALIGDRLDATAACPRCGQAIEIALCALDLLEMAAADDPTLREDGWEIVLRTPTAEDVAAALDDAEPEGVLFDRCVVAISCRGIPRMAGALPTALRARCERRLDELAPLANLEVDATCPSCASVLSMPLDVGAFVAAALRPWAEAQLAEVARLCLVYGWSEADVLAMSSWRRRFYLAHAGAS